MKINFHALTSFAIPAFKDWKLPDLTPSQKKVVAIVCGAFALLAAITYFIYRRYSAAKLETDDSSKSEKEQQAEAKEENVVLEENKAEDIQSSEKMGQDVQEQGLAEKDSPKPQPEQKSEVEEEHVVLEGNKEQDIQPIEKQGEDVEEEKLDPNWINRHPEVPLFDLGFRKYQEVLPFLVQYGRKIKCLNLRGLELEHDELAILLALCPNLTHLAAERMSSSLFILLKEMPLTELSLINCKFNDDKGFANLKDLHLTALAIESSS